jgi:hypothetical protein
LAAAVVLICAIFLPLSQCAGPKTNVWSPAAFAHSRHLFPQNDGDYLYQYASNFVRDGFANPKDNGLIAAVTLIAFLWPLGFAIWSRISRFPRFWWIELLLCAGTAYWIWALRMRGRSLYGFYVAEGAIAIYVVTTVIVIIFRQRDFARRRLHKL